MRLRPITSAFLVILVVAVWTFFFAPSEAFAQRGQGGGRQAAPSSVGVSVAVFVVAGCPLATLLTL
jgi:hypothetical protein